MAVVIIHTLVYISFINVFSGLMPTILKW